MVRVKLIDGSPEEFPREEILGLVPVTGLLRHAHLKFGAVFYLNGKLLPVHGPLPSGKESGDVESRPWLLLFADHVQVIAGLPSFEDDITLPTRIAATKPIAKPATNLAGISATASARSKEEISDAEEEARLLEEMEELLKSA